ncbi:hypothetical protein [Alkalicoccobacillus murimartini]|uniref:SMI1/KNR4 family protein n=1 Tax=Alkalicoccobacillus murimartini TaxID=171685 RepID=A0ABT9YKN5_9BACI|nr:hypothetical protein [Alkalicoccobacillus murimartini]MDQ0208301.1 hypothetical protein [Alkalicoccobacillus murimartini]
MKPLLTCTTEELILLLTLCGFSETARGLGESMLGEKSEESWNTLIDGASHQLILKGVWDLEKSANDEIPLSEDLQEFIRDYATSSYLLRFVDIQAGRSFLLHSLTEEYWIEHVVSHDIIHEFGQVTVSDANKDLKSFYAFKDPSTIEELSFTLSTEQFDLLSESSNSENIQSEIDKPDEKRAFDQFIHVLKEHNWELQNVSRFYLGENQNELQMTDILFFMNSNDGIWCVEYIEENEDILVHFTLKSSSDWLSKCMKLVKKHFVQLETL